MEIPENKYFAHSIISQDLASYNKKVVDINPNNIGSMADFWYKDIGINVIPANTKEKKTFENWSKWQDYSIPVEVHESFKKAGYYNNGIAIITGKIWRGSYGGKHLVAIDLDNMKAIEEFCNNEFEFLKQNTLVEQTSNTDKAHIYFIVDKEIPNKSSNVIDFKLFEKINTNEIPALEVKSNSKGIMFCACSPHKNGSNYQIIGTLYPQIFNASMLEERIRFVCRNHNIPYGTSLDSSSNYSNNNIPIEDLFNPNTKIIEGNNRHLELLRVMESLLQRNRDIMSLEEIKENAQKINQRLCAPPLDRKEFEKQWRCALKFIGKRVKINDNKPFDNTRDIGNINDNSNYDNNISNFCNNDIKSTAEILVELVLETSTLFKDEFEIPHTLLKINNDHYEVLPIEGSKFESYLSKLYYDNRNKKTANAEAINNAVRTLGAKAIFECQRIALHLRVAWSNHDDKDSIYYDLTDEKRRCIKITKGNGWKVVENQIEVLFKRYGHESSQVEPSHDYDNKIFDQFIDSLNIKNENHKLLVKVWIVSLLIPEIPIPMFLPFGTEGSAKSTFQRKIKVLIDPSSLDLLF